MNINFITMVEAMAEFTNKLKNVYGVIIDERVCEQYHDLHIRIVMGSLTIRRIESNYTYQLIIDYGKERKGMITVIYPLDDWSIELWNNKAKKLIEKKNKIETLIDKI